MAPGRPDYLFCADWSADPRKRSVYLARVEDRVVHRLNTPVWTVAGVIAEAERYAREGQVMLSFDAPLGVPRSYLGAVGAATPAAPADFIGLLAWAVHTQSFFDVCADHNWSVMRPFVHIRGGDGSRAGIFNAMRALNVEPLRLIETLCGGNSVFIKSGIPGSVGSAACDIWQALGSLITADRGFRVWPFEGDLARLLVRGSVAIAEIYPRAAYATALLDGTSATRPPLAIPKRNSTVRNEAIDRLSSMDWVQRWHIQLENLSEARRSEDDFDACLTTAALLLCVLEEIDLHDPNIDWVAEGGILGTGSINLQLTERRRVFSRRRNGARGETHPRARASRGERRVYGGRYRPARKCAGGHP